MKKLSEFNVEVKETIDVDLSPLIDMVFLLLIFFMVTTVFVDEVGIDVEKPKAASSASLEKNSIMLAIDHSGKVFYAGHEVSLHGVRGVVSRQLTIKKMPVIISADKASNSGMLVSVIDQCKLAGAGQVSVATAQAD